MESTSIAESRRELPAQMVDGWRLVVDSPAHLGGRPRPRLVLRAANRFWVVDPCEIDCFRADGNYIRVEIADGRSHLVRGVLSELGERLDPRAFLRCHRSAIVNGLEIVEVRLKGNREGTIVLRSGASVPLSRTYRDGLEAWLSRLCEPLG